MKQISEYTIPPKDGYAVVVKKGQHLRVTNIEGTQVVDMAVFNADHPREKLSPSWSRTRYEPVNPTKYVPRDRLTVGANLMSTRCRPLMTIVAETAEPKGIHNTHNRMCCRYMYAVFGLEKDGCAEIIHKAVESYGIAYEDLPDTMDLFMNTRLDHDEKRWITANPVTKPGDYIEFRAEMDCLVGMSNCPEDTLSACNAYTSTPTKVEVFAPE